MRPENSTMFQGAQIVSIGGPSFVNIGTNIIRYYGDDNLLVLRRFTSFAALLESSVQDPDCRCFPGTRKHVLEAIQRWFDNPSADRIFWLRGPMGAGKSAIAQTVGHANMPDKVAATFFFCRSDPSRSDGNRLFTSLAWQFATSIPAIRDHIFHALNIHPNLPARDVETQFEELIVRPFLALNEHTSAVRNKALVVIIDGLDECLDEMLQKRILKVIGTAVRNTDFPLRFLISSRPEAHIEETINRFEPPIPRINLESIDDADSDIEHYLRSGFARIRAERGIEPAWPSDQIVQELVLRSAGRFLYATDVIRLVDDPNSDALTQLDIILRLKPSHTTSPLAVSDQSYMDILMRVPDQDFLKIFLGLLIGRCSISRDSLSKDDAMLMGISSVDLGTKLQEMRSILKFGPDPFFLDFLQDSSRSSQYHVSKSAGTRRYLDLMTKLLIERAARLTEQPDFHGTDHFVPEFGELINRNPQAIELEVGDWGQTLRPLLNVLDKLLVPSNIDSLKAGYCQECRFFQITHDTLTHFKSLQEKEDADVEKCVKSLEEIISAGVVIKDISSLLQDAPAIQHKRTRKLLGILRSIRSLFRLSLTRKSRSRLSTGSSHQQR